MIHDHCGRPLDAPARASRIVSLCPSQTETLIALGAPVVGRTRYCVHPADAVADIAEVGGTKNPDHAAIAALRPDLIIAEKEENRREDVEALAARWPVYVTDVRGLDGARRMIADLGALCGRDAAARALAASIARAWDALPRLEPGASALYLIWRKPWMAAGADTYIDAVLERLGLINLARDFTGRYPRIATGELAALDADFCLLSSEPFPFAQRHIAELQPLMPRACIQLVDGEAFSWYGARMQPAADPLARLVGEWAAAR